MTAGDESILRFFASHPSLELTTGNIARNTNLSRSYTSNRVGVLVEKDLLTVDDGDDGYPFYTISDKGLDLVEGEIDPEVLE